MREVLIVEDESDGQRLDRWLATRLEGLSRAQVQELIDSQRVRVGARAAKASQRVHAGDRVEVERPPPRSVSLQPEEMNLHIVYEDESILVVNKRSGMLTHPAGRVEQGTLVNALLARTRGRLATIGAPRRPGIVHRLDRDTSGLIAVAKTDAAYAHLVAQFKNREVEKIYLALVQGAFDASQREGVIEMPIGRHPRDRKRMSAVAHRGRPARTDFRVLRRFEEQTLLWVRPHTGRTHQIRVHLARIGHPIVGDSLYGRASRGSRTRLMLHAWQLALWHPQSGKRVRFSAPPPPEFPAPGPL